MIRLARDDEADVVSALITAAYQDYVPRMGRLPQPMTDDYAAFIAAGTVRVLEVAGAVAGVLVLEEKEDHLLVRTVGIAPNQQRNGFGSLLMAHAEAVAAQSGHGMLKLYTNEAMTGNVELYTRLGYGETHRAGPDGVQVIYMEKRLTR